MIIGFHYILSAYGFWLPDDPKESWSKIVRELEPRKFGPAIRVSTTRSVAGRSHDVSLRFAAKEALRYPPVKFTGKQAVLVAQGFGDAVAEHGYVINALAVLPDHVHLVMRYCIRSVEKIAAHLKAKATARLSAAGTHPLANDASPAGRITSPWHATKVSIYI